MPGLESPAPRPSRCHLTALRSVLMDYREHGLYTDVAVTTGDGRVVRLHSAVVAAALPWAGDLLAGVGRAGCPPDGDVSIVMPDTEAGPLLEAVRLLYLEASPAGLARLLMQAGGGGGDSDKGGAPVGNGRDGVKQRTEEGEEEKEKEEEEVKEKEKEKEEVKVEEVEEMVVKSGNGTNTFGLRSSTAKGGDGGVQKTDSRNSERTDTKDPLRPRRCKGRKAAREEEAEAEAATAAAKRKGRPPTGGPRGCEACGKQFRSEAKYKRHVVINHEPVTCPVCGKLLKNVYILKTHVDRHNGKGGTERKGSAACACRKIKSANSTLN